mgnify:CR=1 FL=1
MGFPPGRESDSSILHHASPRWCPAKHTLSLATIDRVLPTAIWWESLCHHRKHHWRKGFDLYVYISHVLGTTTHRSHPRSLPDGPSYRPEPPALAYGVQHPFYISFFAKWPSAGHGRKECPHRHCRTAAAAWSHSSPTQPQQDGWTSVWCLGCTLTSHGAVLGTHCPSVHRRDWHSASSRNAVSIQLGRGGGTFEILAQSPHCWHSGRW